MINYLNLLQIIVATSVAYVWIFRYDNIINEFKHFGLSDLTRTSVGAAKISLATLIIVGIWYQTFVVIPSALMGLIMLAAQYFHIKNKSSFVKLFPSLILLILCISIVVISTNSY